MEKIVVPTRFNKTGKRVLTIPLDERQVCAPAHRLCREACNKAKDEWIHKWNAAKQTYVESMAHWIASHVARDSTPVAERYKITKLLAELSLAQKGPVPIPGRVDSERWSIQLGIPELSDVEQAAWETYLAASHKADVDRDAAFAEAEAARNTLERALRREISNHIHHQYDPEDTY